MRKWSTSRKLICAFALVVLVGFAPLLYIEWFSHAHNFEPLSMPLPQKAGTYSSPFFATDLDEPYQIEIYFLPPDRTPLNLNWKIVDDSGAVLQAGNFRDSQLGGNSVLLGQYAPGHRARQQLIVALCADADMAANPAIHIGVPEESLDMSYAFLPAGLWAVAVIGIGGLTLFLVGMRQGRRAKRTTAA